MATLLGDWSYHMADPGFLSSSSSLSSSSLFAAVPFSLSFPKTFAFSSPTEEDRHGDDERASTPVTIDVAFPSMFFSSRSSIDNPEEEEEKELSPLKGGEENEGESTSLFLSRRLSASSSDLIQDLAQKEQDLSEDKKDLDAVVHYLDPTHGLVTPLSSSSPPSSSSSSKMSTDLSSLWPIGLVVILIGSFVGAAGDILVKKSFLKLGKYTPFRQLIRHPLWIVGMILTAVLDPLSTFISLLFAPATIVTPFAGMHIFWGCVLAIFWLKEKMFYKDLVGASFILTGITLIVVYSGKDQIITSVHDLAVSIRYVESIVYICIASILICLSFLFSSDRVIRYLFKKPQSSKRRSSSISSTPSHVYHLDTRKGTLLKNKMIKRSTGVLLNSPSSSSSSPSVSLRYGGHSPSSFSSSRQKDASFLDQPELFEEHEASFPVILPPSCSFFPLSPPDVLSTRSSPDRSVVHPPCLSSLRNERHSTVATTCCESDRHFSSPHTTEMKKSSPYSTTVSYSSSSSSLSPQQEQNEGRRHFSSCSSLSFATPFKERDERTAQGGGGGEEEEEENEDESGEAPRTVFSSSFTPSRIEEGRGRRRTTTSLKLVNRSSLSFSSSISPTGLSIQRFALSCASGIVGGCTNVGAKILVILLAEFMNYPLQALSRWSTYLILFLTSILGFFQLYYLNLALRKYEATYVVPMINSFLIAFGALGGIYVLQEKPQNASLFFTGLAIVVLGIFVLSSFSSSSSRLTSKKKKKKITPAKSEEDKASSVMRARSESGVKEGEGVFAMKTSREAIGRSSSSPDGRRKEEEERRGRDKDEEEREQFYDMDSYRRHYEEEEDIDEKKKKREREKSERLPERFNRRSLDLLSGRNQKRGGEGGEGGYSSSSPSSPFHDVHLHEDDCPHVYRFEDYTDQERKIASLEGEEEERWRRGRRGDNEERDLSVLSEGALGPRAQASLAAGEIVRFASFMSSFSGGGGGKKSETKEQRKTSSSSSSSSIFHRSSRREEKKVKEGACCCASSSSSTMAFERGEEKIYRRNSGGDEEEHRGASLNDSRQTSPVRKLFGYSPYHQKGLLSLPSESDDSNGACHMHTQREDLKPTVLDEAEEGEWKNEEEVDKGRTGEDQGKEKREKERRERERQLRIIRMIGVDRPSQISCVSDVEEEEKKEKGNNYLYGEEDGGGRRVRQERRKEREDGEEEEEEMTLHAMLGGDHDEYIRSIHEEKKNRRISPVYGEGRRRDLRLDSEHLEALETQMEEDDGDREDRYYHDEEEREGSSSSSSPIVVVHAVRECPTDTVIDIDDSTPSSHSLGEEDEEEEEEESIKQDLNEDNRGEEEEEEDKRKRRRLFVSGKSFLTDLFYGRSQKKEKKSSSSSSSSSISPSSRSYHPSYEVEEDKDVFSFPSSFSTSPSSPYFSEKNLSREDMKKKKRKSKKAKEMTDSPLDDPHHLYLTTAATGTTVWSVDTSLPPLPTSTSTSAAPLYLRDSEEERKEDEEENRLNLPSPKKRIGRSLVLSSSPFSFTALRMKKKRSSLPSASSSCSSSSRTVEEASPRGHLHQTTTGVSPKRKHRRDSEDSISLPPTRTTFRRVQGG